VVRILFLPVEESARQYFGRLQDALNCHQSATTTTNNSTNNTNATPSNVANQLMLKKSMLMVLATIIRLHVYLGLLFIAFGSQYTRPLIGILAGPTWSQRTDAGGILALYCWLLPILGLNGIVEGFVQAVATAQEIQQMTRWMAGFSVVYYSTAVLLTWWGWGTAGLLLANALNMGLRVVWSARFIQRYFHGHDRADLLWQSPHWAVWLAFSCSAAIIYAINDLSLKLTSGVGLALVCVWVIYRFERERIREVSLLLRHPPNEKNKLKRF
jgi:oligosaccharide translocation protein RFT1